MMTHKLRCWPEHFNRVMSGKKPFEIRKNDRFFQAGDHVVLLEFEPEARHIKTSGRYTGRQITMVITCVDDFHQMPGVVVLGISDPRTMESNTNGHS